MDVALFVDDKIGELVEISGADPRLDVAVAHPVFTVRRMATELGVSIGRANKLVDQLVDLGVLQTGGSTYNRQFHAPIVLDILLRRSTDG